MSLQGFLIGRLQPLEELLRLPTEVAVETPVTPTGRRNNKHEEDKRGYHLCVRPEEKDSLPGNRASLCVCIVDAFLYGLHQDGPMPGGWRLMAETIKYEENL